MQEDLERLIELAESALETDEESVDLFIEQVDGYIALLESWTNDAQQQPPGSELKPAVEQLNDLHGKVLARALRLGQKLGTELGSANKKGRVLRAYVDRLPQRITITGRRKG